MTGHGSKRVLTIPSGAPFLRTLAKALLDGSLIPGFVYNRADPLSLAATTIYVPTRRAARALRSELVDLLGGRSAILPTIRPLGETDDDSGFFDETMQVSDDLLPPLPGVARLLELARLVLAWRNQLPQVVTDIHSGSPLVAPASPADAIWLARSLTELIDSMETEERDWESLQKLDSQDHALWFQLTTAFLKIASVFWPRRLNELHRSSPARNRNAILRTEAQRLLLGHETGPVIVAGSTGSVPATSELIAAVAGLPLGAVVLPGLDTTMSDDDWAMIHRMDADGAISRDPADRSHPQYGLATLMHRLSVERKDVVSLGTVAADLGLRADILGQAMAASESTAQWMTWRQAISDAGFAEAFADAALIEAANEREEATAIAIALKLALSQADERQDQTQASQVALITPDRNLARRVQLELLRFGIEADDSAGTPFLVTQQGSFLQLVLESCLRPGDPVAIVALMKHPLFRLGLPAEAVQDAAAALEILALRGGVSDVDIGNLDALLDAMIEARKDDRHAPQWRLSLPDRAEEHARELIGRLTPAIEPLVGAMVGLGRDGKGLSTELDLSDWATRTGQVLEALSVDERGSLGALWSDEAGDTLATLLSGIIEAEGQMQANSLQWIDIVNALASSESIKPKAQGHPRVSIWGTLEARLQHVDLLVLAGLNEGSWPGQTANNPFLSRTMKTEIGLEPPERKTGQLAHDFQMACGTRKVIFSRSVRQGSAPTVASRWLQRLLALGGKTFAETLQGRGDVYLRYAGLMDSGEMQDAARRPEPVVPPELVPTRYSFSEVGRLRRDPYAIYAKRVLKLDPVDPFNTDPGVSERGTLYHAIVDRFVRDGHVASDASALDAMRRILNEAFDAERLPAHIDAVWRPRFFEVAKAFLNWQAERQGQIQKSFTEARAHMDIAGGWQLTGIADRIDLTGPKSADIIDYKTGFAPSVSQARALLDPQLALEAAALKAGAFKDMGAKIPQSLIYVRLKPGDKFKAETVNNEFSKASGRSRIKSADDLAAEALEQFVQFVELLKSGKRGFSSRLIPQSQTGYGEDYDHLARVAEWATADSEDDGDE
jgi:ATP-dependent helicase/nuclease subunit B